MEIAQDNEYKCDECELIKKSVLICLACVETLCPECDSKIHNKGTRVKHKRISSKYKLYEDKNNGFEVTFFARQFYRNQFQEILSEKQNVQKIVYDFVLDQTKNGKLMVVSEEICELVRKNFDLKNQIIEEYLLDTGKNPLFHQTIRTFGDQLPLKYFSLKLNQVSLESIIWILKSIFLDKMKPVDSLVLSRFKECFTLQIRKNWKNFLNFLIKNPKAEKKLNKYHAILGEVSLQLEQNNVVLFQLNHLKWDYEDMDIIEENNQDYILFVDFMKTFISENTFESDFDNKNTKWISSVENSLVKNSPHLNESLYIKILQNNGIVKAIPGGKYGCALMLKHCGPDSLKALSIGRIIAFISLALKTEVLVHIKTYIVLNQKEKKEPTKELNEQILEIQQKILTILKENPDQSVTLAQLPSMLVEKYGKDNVPDFTELGFPKLKNLIITMIDQIEIKEFHKNHIKVKLKENSFIKNFSLHRRNQKQHNLYDNSKDLMKSFNNENKREGIKTLKKNEFEEKCKQMDNYFGSFAEHKKSHSTLEGYLNDIKFFVINILKENPFGIEINKLEERLSEHLKTKFEPKIFKAEDFEEFLLNTLEGCLDIQIMKQLKSIQGNKNKTTRMVYPKNFVKPSQNQNFSYFQKSLENEYGIFDDYCQSYDQHSGFFSEQSVHNFFSKNIQTNDSYSENNSTLNNFQNKDQNLSNLNQNAENDSNIFSGFQYQVVSPIPTCSNTLAHVDQDQDEEIEEEDNEDFINSSRRYIEELIKED